MKIMNEYRFSMTAASLMTKEFVELAQSLIDAEFDYSKISSTDLLRDRDTTRKREFAELQLRMKMLSENEIFFLANTNDVNQKLLTFLACVKVYRILREFIEEVIWNKLLVFDEQLHSRDFVGFIYDKGLDYSEVETLSDNTKKKIQQVIFKMLEQAGLIDNVRSKKIIVPFFDYSLQNNLSDLDKKYLLNL